MSGRYNLVKEFIIKPIKNLVKGESKTSPTISSVRPTIPTTKLEKTTSKLNIAKHKTKMSKAKLNQTLFDIDRASKKAKARIIDRNNESKKMFKAVEGKKDGGRMGLKRGGGKFPDHSGDGKITQKDILMAKGVIPKTKSKKKVI